MAINKNGVSMTMEAIKLKNGSTVFYLKAKRYAPKGFSPQQANINILEKKEFQYDKDESENWSKKIGLPQEIDINVAHRYLFLEERWLSLTCDALGIKLTRTLEVFDGCEIPKEKEHTVRKKTYI